MHDSPTSPLATGGESLAPDTVDELRTTAMSEEASPPPSNRRPSRTPAGPIQMSDDENDDDIGGKSEDERLPIDFELLTISDAPAPRRSSASVTPQTPTSSLSTKELKELITSAGLSYADCVEKFELRARAREALRLASAACKLQALMRGRAARRRLQLLSNVIPALVRFRAARRRARLAKEAWNASDWIKSDVNELNIIVANQLLEAGRMLSPPQQGRSSAEGELEAMIALANEEKRCPGALRRCLNGIVDRLEAALAPKLAELADRAASQSATPEQLHNRFAQDDAGLLSYSDLSTFFHGLEKQVGPPDPNVQSTMCAEHTEKDDAFKEFKTDNYGVTTTSAVEWDFAMQPVRQRVVISAAEHHDSVMQPASSHVGKKGVVRKYMPKSDGGIGGEYLVVLDETDEEVTVRPELLTVEDAREWPIETRGAGADADHRRQPKPIHALDVIVNDLGAALAKKKEPRLTLDEGVGARLYTGPLYVKYNTVLRGIGTKAAQALRLKMIELCCADDVAVQYLELHQSAAAYKQARKKLNSYTTTLHAINSAIVKLSKLTQACKVYRGISGRRLPDQFLIPNEYGVRGGIESSFMSTSIDRDVAMAYASGASVGILFEIKQGMIDRGAQLGKLSQYEHEVEVLYAPLTGLEVQGTRVEGTVLVVEAKVSINLMSLTMEKVIGKRKTMLEDMVPGLKAEVLQCLCDEGLATEDGKEMLLESIEAKLRRKGGPLSHPPEDYNQSDDLVKDALEQMLKIVRGIKVGGCERVSALAQYDGCLSDLGFPPEAYTTKIATALETLASNSGRSWTPHVNALHELQTLPEIALSHHATAVVAKLRDTTHYKIREAAVQLLGQYPAVLKQHMSAVVGLLVRSTDGPSSERIDDRPEVRKAAAEALAKLDISDLKRLRTRLKSVVDGRWEQHQEVKEAVRLILARLLRHKCQFTGALRTINASARRRLASVRAAASTINAAARSHLLATRWRRIHAPEQ